MNPYNYINQLPVQNVTPAQEAIENALLSLNDEKEIYKIAVKELCARANVARSTFYAYYEVIDDCLANIENRLICKLITLNDELCKPEKIETLDLSFFEETLKYINMNQKNLYLFLVKRYNHRFVNKWKDAIKYHLYNRMPKHINEKNKELTLEIIAAQTIGAYQYWLENPYDLDIEYVKKLLRRIIEAYTEQ